MSPATGANAPLLCPKNAPAEQRRVICRAVFNVSTSIIGAGIMSIPATLKVLGVIPAFVLTAAVAVLVDISVDFLLRFTYAGTATTYGGLMKESFGKFGSLALQLCIMITNLGCLIMYLIIIGDVLCGNGSEHLGVLQEWFGIHWWNSRAFAILFVLIFVLLPLVLYRRVESLWWSSAIAVLLALVFVGVCTVMAIYALIKGQTQPLRLVPHFDGSASSYLNLFTAVPVIVTAFTFHFNVHPIGMEIGKPSTMSIAVKISLLLCAALYFTIGIFGYLLFGESLNADILVNFTSSSTSSISPLLNDIVRLSYAFHLVLVFPLLNFSLRANVDELLFPKKQQSLVTTATERTGKATDGVWRFVCLSLVLLALSYIAAIAIPSIWYIFQFMGSTSAVCLAFIFPGAIAIRDIHGISTRKDKILATIMIVQAIITSCIAIYTNIYNIVNPTTS